jgi:Rad3-related DNA helicase
MEELSRVLINFSKIVPGGLVCFLPSYDYESTLFTRLQTSGSKEKIETRKKVHIYINRIYECYVFFTTFAFRFSENQKTQTVI